MATDRIDKLVVRESAGGPSAIEITAYLTDVDTNTQHTIVTNLDVVDNTGPGAIQAALADADEDIDFTI